MLEIERQIQPKDAVDIWIVVGFFQRLSFLVQKENVDAEMAIELFGELFLWWWVVSFETQLMPVDWDARDRIRWLKEWFDSKTTVERRDPWIRRAQRDRTEAEDKAFVEETLRQQLA